MQSSIAKHNTWVQLDPRGKALLDGLQITWCRKTWFSAAEHSLAFANSSAAKRHCWLAGFLSNGFDLLRHGWFD